MAEVPLPRPIRLLILEDNPQDAEYAIAQLQHDALDLECQRVDTEADFIASLDRHPDLILADYSLPSFDAVAALKHLQALQLDIPVIVVSGTLGDEQAVRVLREGAADYLLKDRIQRLGPAVRRALEEHARRREYQDLVAIVTCSHDAIVGLDMRGDVINWNAGAEQLYGLHASDIKGRSIRLVLPAEHQAELFDAVAQVTRGQRVGPVEATHVHRDGRLIDVSLTLSPVRSAAGEVIGVASIIRDIGAKKRAERLLLESERRYRSMFEHNPIPMWVHDTGTLRFLAVNDAAVRHYGYSRAEFLSMPLADLLCRSDPPALWRGALDSSGPEATGASALSRHRKKNGTVIDVQIQSYELTYAGQPGRVVLATDVTEQLRAQEQLRVAEERLRLALAASHVGVWDTNLETGVAYWSETCELMHGLSPGTFGGNFNAFVACIHPDDREQAAGIVRRAIEEHAETEFEYRTLLPDGTVRRISSTAHFFYDEAGKAIRGAGVTSDVTERRSLEHQLRQSQKMEAVGQLAGGVAHDFNNLLTAILGYADLLEPELEGQPGGLEDLEQIRKSAMRAAHLTRQLLAFSRRQILQSTVIDLNSLIADLGNLLRRLIPENVRIDLVLPPRIHRIKADPGQIEQVVMNLAINARDAMPSGGTLTIETANREVNADFFRNLGVTGKVDSRHFVTLTIRETGTGMDNDTKRRIFEPFFTTKHKGKGTGLGLATVYGIVKQSDGFICLESEPNCGATFTVYLPKTTEATAHDVPAPQERRMATGTETILLVEDEEAVRLLTLALLERHGYHTLTAVDAEDAIRLAEAEGGPIHLLLADVILPGQDGPALYRILKASRPALKSLFMSGYTDEAILKRGILDRKAAFLHKPFTAAELSTKVRDVLDQHDAAL